MVVKWFTLLGLIQYSPETAFTSGEECGALIWTNASGTEEHIHANSPAQWKINAHLEMVQGSLLYSCECIFCFVRLGTAVLYSFALAVKYYFSALLICTIQLPKLVPFNCLNSTLELYNCAAMCTHFQSGSVAEEVEEGGRGGRD